MLTRRNIVVVAGLFVVVAGVLAALGLGAMKVAQADQWPTRPITMVVPFAAGGPTDVVGRILAARVSEILKQQIIVVNVGGAGGMAGAERVAKAMEQDKPPQPPDSYPRRSDSALPSRRTRSCRRPSSAPGT